MGGGFRHRPHRKLQLRLQQKSMKSKIISALVFSLVSLPSMAQMISQTTDDFVLSSAAIGQTFEATTTVSITRISVRPNTNCAPTLYLYNGNAGSGTPGAVGAPAYTQAGVNLASSISGGTMRDIVLTTPFPVTAGSSYTFILSGACSMYAKNVNPYPNGSSVFDYATLDAGFDLAFQIWADPLVPAATTASIPTLSEWGVISTSAVLALFGLYRLRRQSAGRA
jgi:hypothetical protein